MILQSSVSDFLIWLLGNPTGFFVYNKTSLIIEYPNRFKAVTTNQDINRVGRADPMRSAKRCFGVLGRVLGIKTCCRRLQVNPWVPLCHHRWLRYRTIDGNAIYPLPESCELLYKNSQKDPG